MGPFYEGQSLESSIKMMLISQLRIMMKLGMTIWWKTDPNCKVGKCGKQPATQKKVGLEASYNMEHIQLKSLQKLLIMLKLLNS